jgi:c-di-GMP-binding flagellar brake protein YcgR
MSPKKYLTTVRRKIGKSKVGKSKTGSKEGMFVVERRKNPRISVELPLDYSLVDTKENFGGIAANMCEGGLLVYLPESIKLGSLLRIEILFVKGSELSSISGIAKIVWSDLAPKRMWGEYRYGLEFQSFQKGDLNKLKSLLNEVEASYNECSP